MPAVPAAARTPRTPHARRRARGPRVLLVGALVAGLGGLPALTAPAAAEGQGQRFRVVKNDSRVVRLASKETARVPLRASSLAVGPTDPVTAPFVVNYLPAGSPAWTATKRAAFQRAVDVWSRLLVSPRVVEIDAVMEPLPSGFLGSAGPADLVQDKVDGTWYPVALRNALDDVDHNGAAPEIDAVFPSSDSNIYYGTGTPPDGTYDFTSTVMHEIGHGLGFLGSLEVVGNRGFKGLDDDGNGVDSGDFPVVYDKFPVRVDGTQQPATVTPLLAYPNNSQELASALTSGEVFWQGSSGILAAGGARPRLHAPATWESGTSYSHLDEATYPTGSLNSLMTPYGAFREINAEPGPIALGMMQDMGWQLSAAAGPPPATRYSPVDPVRVMDTRPAPDNVGVRVGRLGAGGTVDLQVTGVAGVPADATAVVLNVTGVAPTLGTDLRVYPAPTSGTAVPLVSSLNLSAGRTRANLVTVKVGPSGKVRFRNNGGTVHLLADLAGYYSPGAAATYFPVSPGRVLDTRPGSNVGAPVGKVLGGDTRDLTVAGTGSVPATATAVVLGVTAVSATQTTDIRVYPTPLDGSGAPLVSTINVSPGGPTPNLAIVKVGAAGQVRLRNNSGAVDLLADVYGYYEQSSAGALFRALSPDRVLDTRATAQRRVPGGSFVDLAMAGAGGVAGSATAVVLNVTGTETTASTDVRVFPAPASGTAVPTVSTLNLVRGQTAADAAIVPVGSGSRVRFYNSAGAVALIADVAGWFGPA